MLEAGRSTGEIEAISPAFFREVWRFAARASLAIGVEWDSTPFECEMQRWLVESKDGIKAGA